MVFNYTLLSSHGETLGVGQIHVQISPMEQTKALAEALAKLSGWLLLNPLSSLPSGVTIKIATIG